MFSENLDRLIYDVIDEAIPHIERVSANAINQEISEFVMRSQSNGMISGIDIIQRLIQIVDDSIEIKIINGSGSLIEKDDIIAIIRGNTSTIMQVKSLIIVICERLSQIASSVHRLRSNLHDSNIHIYAHEVFTPLFRTFEEYAIESTGGRILNRSFSQLELISALQIPTNMSLDEAMEHFKERIDHSPTIGVEVTNNTQYVAAIQSECDIIVLCDFSMEELSTLLQLDAPGYLRIIRGRYDMNELLRINELHPDGIFLESLYDYQTRFHITLEQTR